MRSALIHQESGHKKPPSPTISLVSNLSRKLIPVADCILGKSFLQSDSDPSCCSWKLDSPWWEKWMALLHSSQELINVKTDIKLCLWAMAPWYRGAGVPGLRSEILCPEGGRALGRILRVGVGRPRIGPHFSRLPSAVIQ